MFVDYTWQCMTMLDATHQTCGDLSPSSGCSATAVDPTVRDYYHTANGVVVAAADTTTPGVCVCVCVCVCVAVCCVAEE